MAYKTSKKETPLAYCSVTKREKLNIGNFVFTRIWQVIIWSDQSKSTKQSVSHALFFIDFYSITISPECLHISQHYLQTSSSCISAGFVSLLSIHHWGSSSVPVGFVVPTICHHFSACKTALWEMNMLVCHTFKSCKVKYIFELLNQQRKSVRRSYCHTLAARVCGAFLYNFQLNPRNINHDNFRRL